MLTRKDEVSNELCKKKKIAVESTVNKATIIFNFFTILKLEIYHPRLRITPPTPTTQKNKNKNIHTHTHVNSSLLVAYMSTQMKSSKLA
jgi:hypothetical protein